MSKDIRKLKHAGITIYLCLSLCVILTLVFACIESARLSAGRAALSCAVDEGMFSLFSNYDSTLFEKYGLMFFDAGYTTDELKMGNVTQELTEYVQAVLSADGEGNTVTVSDLYRICLDTTDVTGFVLATDSNYAKLIEQINEVMLLKLGDDALENLEKLLETYTSAATQYSLDSEDEIDTLAKSYEEQKEQAEQLAEEAQNADADIKSEKETENTSETEIPDDFTNPIENLTSLRKMGIMSFAIPKDASVSQAEIDTSDTLSKRSLYQGLGIMPEENTSTLSKLSITQFVSDFFTDFVSADDADMLLYQKEYVIAGKSSDTANLKAVLNKILLMRLGFNYIYLMSDSVKTAEIYEMAAILGAVLIIPEAIALIAKLLRLLWAYAESMQDVKTLLAEGKVPLFKDASSWGTSLSRLSELSSDTESEGSSKGLEYDDYLQILMYTMSEDDLISRTADMIEYNKRIADDNEDFRLDLCLSSLETEIHADVGSYELTVNRSYGYDM